MLAKMSLCSTEEDCGSLDVEDDLHSPTDVSEDSVEVRVTPIAGPTKRKLVVQSPASAAPRGPAGPARPARPAGPGYQSQCPKRTALSPSPKRRRPASPLSPFRPWSVPSAASAASAASAPPPATQEEPLALVKSRVTTATTTVAVIPRSHRSPRSPRSPRATKAAAVAAASRFSVEAIIGDVMNNKSAGVSAPPEVPADPGEGSSSGSVAGQQRNYKNMTRERRIEANARERTRVHTISAAFDTLRRSVPAYSHSQKLSKLSVLRIACSYILTLSRVAGMDYSADQSRPPVQDCVDLVTRTIQTEGKLRRKKDD